MYEQFKHLIMAELSKDFSVDQLRKISECLDLAAKNFDVVKKVTLFIFDCAERFLQIRGEASGKGFCQ